MIPNGVDAIAGRKTISSQACPWNLLPKRVRCPEKRVNSTLGVEVGDQRSGLLFEKGNRSDLAAKIRVLCRDGDLLRRLQDGAHEVAESSAWDVIA